MVPVLPPMHFAILEADHSIRWTNDVLEWAKAFEGRDRRVAFTTLAPGVTVSTVFLGLPHPSWSEDNWGLFETMVFTDYGGDECYRYATWDEAAEGHERVVAEVRKKLGPASSASSPEGAEQADGDEA